MQCKSYEETTTTTRKEKQEKNKMLFPENFTDGQQMENPKVEDKCQSGCTMLRGCPGSHLPFHQKVH